MTYDWQAREGVLLKLQTLTDYEPTDAELATLSPEHRGVVKGWRVRGEAMAAGAGRKASVTIIEATEPGWYAVSSGNPRFCFHGKTMQEAQDQADKALDLYAASQLAGSAEAGGVSDVEVEAGVWTASELKVETYRRSDELLNVPDTCVRITHLPTGKQASSEDERSQHANRRVTLDRLRHALAEPTP